jgi:hypothetical protein
MLKYTLFHFFNLSISSAIPWSNRLCLNPFLPLLHSYSDLSIQHRKFPGAPGSQSDFLEIGMQQLGESGGNFGKNLVDIIRFQPDLGMFFFCVFRILEKHDAQPVFVYYTKRVIGVQLIMAHGELETIDKSFQAYADVKVEKTRNEFSEVHVCRFGVNNGFFYYYPIISMPRI